MGYQQNGKQTVDQANQVHFKSCSRIKVQSLFIRLYAGSEGGGGGGGGTYRSSLRPDLTISCQYVSSETAEFLSMLVHHDDKQNTVHHKLY